MTWPTAMISRDLEDRDDEQGEEDQRSTQRRPAGAAAYGLAPVRLTGGAIVGSRCRRRAAQPGRRGARTPQRGDAGAATRVMMSPAHLGVADLALDEGDRHLDDAQARPGRRAR